MQHELISQGRSQKARPAARARPQPNQWPPRRGGRGAAAQGRCCLSESFVPTLASENSLPAGEASSIDLDFSGKTLALGTHYPRRREVLGAQN